MKLWILKAKEGAPPWKPWYDKAFGYVIEAATEGDARQIATDSGGDEVQDYCDAWTNPLFSTCDELVPVGVRGVVLQDFKAA